MSTRNNLSGQIGMFQTARIVADARLACNSICLRKLTIIAKKTSSVIEPRFGA